MAKTKEQKNKAVEQGTRDLKASETVLLVDFTGLPVNKMNAFRREIRGSGGVFQVIKKRLLKFIFESAGIVYDPKRFEGQTGVIFSPKDVYETSSLTYKFAAKEKDAFRILGGFRVKAGEFIESDLIVRLGRLPGREVLLAQLVGLLASPIRMFMHVLSEKGRQS